MTGAPKRADEAFFGGGFHRFGVRVSIDLVPVRLLPLKEIAPACSPLFRGYPGKRAFSSPWPPERIPVAFFFKVFARGGGHATV